MAVRKVSLALDAGVAAAVAAAAAADGVSLSAWFRRAAEHELAVAEGRDAVRAFEAEHGSFTGAELAEADRTLDRILQGRAAPGR